MKSILASKQKSTLALAVGVFLLGRYLTVNRRRVIFMIMGIGLLIFGTKPEARFIGLLLLGAAIYSYIPIRNVYGMISQVAFAGFTSYMMVNYGLPLVDKLAEPIRRKLLKAA